MNDVSSPRVAILGRCALFADAMRAALERSGLAVPQAAAISEDAVAELDGAADVIVLDAGDDAIAWIRRLRETAGGRDVVTVLRASNDACVVAVLEAGASAWIDRDASLAQLVRAVRARRATTSTRIVGMVGDRIHVLARELRRAPAAPEVLTRREAQVLRLLAQGLSNKDIASRLGVWTHTVKTHLHNLYAKLDAHSRREAVTRALRLGILRERFGESAPRHVDAVGSVTRAILSGAPRGVAEIFTAIDASTSVVEEFATLALSAAGADDRAAVSTLYHSLEPLLERYGPPTATRRFDHRDFDYFRFLGHELLVTLIAALLREGRWRAVGDLLDERFAVTHAAGSHAPRLVTFGYASELVESLDELANKRGVLSVHAELLESRRRSIPFDEFVAADYFLFLRGEIAPDAVPQQGFEWRPWSTAHLRTLPRFLHDAIELRVAEQLAIALRAGDVATLRARLIERAPRLDRLWATPVTVASLGKVGTK
jgi:DNA-binding NarL/FixJ family response regulator